MRANPAAPAAVLLAESMTTSAMSAIVAVDGKGHAGAERPRGNQLMLDVSHRITYDVMVCVGGAGPTVKMTGIYSVR
jgi:hypothetical protein